MSVAMKSLFRAAKATPQAFSAVRAASTKVRAWVPRSAACVFTACPRPGTHGAGRV